MHAISFQSFVTPNGLIANLFGSVEGCRHDSGMLAISRLLNQLEQYTFSPNGEPLCVLRDLAYPKRVHLQRPVIRRAPLAVKEQVHNSSMCRVCVAVEWVFLDIVNYFKFVDYKKYLKISWSAVGKIDMVCALLRNALTCL